MKKKIEKNTNKNKLNKTMHKTRLTQNKTKKTKHTINAKQKQEKEREKVIESLGALFFPHLGRNFPFSEPLIWRWKGRVKTVQVRKEHEGFEKISKRSKRGWKLTLVSQRDHAIALLSG